MLAFVILLSLAGTFVVESIPEAEEVSSVTTKQLPRSQLGGVETQSSFFEFKRQLDPEEVVVVDNVVCFVSGDDTKQNAFFSVAPASFYTTKTRLFVAHNKILSLNPATENKLGNWNRW